MCPLATFLQAESEKEKEREKIWIGWQKELGAREGGEKERERMTPDVKSAWTAPAVLCWKCRFALPQLL